MSIHWAAQYRTAPSDTLEGKIYIAAGSTARPEDQVRDIGRIAFEQGTNIWHATSLYAGTLATCACSPCERNRKTSKR